MESESIQRKADFLKKQFLKLNQHIPDRFKQKLFQKSLFEFSRIRTLGFAVQGLLVPQVEKEQNTVEFLKNYFEKTQNLQPKVNQLLMRDIENISAGIYPVEVLSIENPLEHFRRISKLWKDAKEAHQRRVQQEHRAFSQEVENELNDYPEYYQRNFHFQTDGYLSSDSAELYEHQVEVLFSGTAQTMRRQVIPAIKLHLESLKYLQANNENRESKLSGQDLNKQKPLKILEIGCGTGALTKNLALAFSQAQITCLDISPHYLNKAQVNLHDFSQINFKQGLAEKLDFEDGQFDVVISCYLFHELPYNIREQVISESQRVLKQNGLLVAADSLQKDDDHELNWALEQFPQNYHEPFFKNYTLNPLEVMFEQSGLKNVQSESFFLTKVVTAVKNQSII